MKIKYIALFLVLALVGCQRDEEMEVTQLTISNERIEPSCSSVTISCDITSNVTIKEATVYVSESKEISAAKTQVLSKKSGNTYSAEIDGLADGATYYVRYQISNRWISLMAEEISEFQTIPATKPIVTTTQPKEITHNGAIIGGKIVDNGGLTITDCGVVYSKSPNPTIENGTKVESKEKTESFTCTINDLDFTTSYYARAYAINEKGIAYGEEISLTTLSTSATMGDISAIEIGGTTATIQAELLADGGANISQLGICYNLKGEPTTNDSVVLSSENKMGIFQCTIDHLSGATAYYVRAFATNANGTVYSDQISFRTETAIATVISSQATNVSCTSATVGGNVTSDGGASVTERGVCYSTTPNPTTSNTKIVNGSGTGSFTCELTDLQDGTTYYVRAYAINELGVGYGNEVSFVTTAYSVPELTIQQPTKYSVTSATIDCEVTYNGGLEVTSRGVCYGTNPNPTISNSKVDNGSGVGVYSCELSNLTEATTYYVRAYATNSEGIAYSKEVCFTTRTRTYMDGYEYVDLGLSVKWATMNVGAESPEDYGDYFAWGETEPKDIYEWSTYKWCNGSDDSFTKYNTKSNYGALDNKTTLEMSDDAARANWGGSWRMPTFAELTELREQCTWTWITQNSVKGYRVTSKSNGNSIFLPAAGCYCGSSLERAGSNGHYWSSSLRTDYPDQALYVRFDFKYGVNAGGCAPYRKFGWSVRPVSP